MIDVKVDALNFGQICNVYILPGTLLLHFNALSITFHFIASKIKLKLSVIQNDIGRGVNEYLCYFQNGGYFSKWLPPISYWK